MLVESGAEMVALTRSLVCGHCNNGGPHGVFQKYEKSYGFFPKTNYFGIFSMCPVCETRTTIVTFKPFFSTARTMADLINLLHQGRELTKLWFDRLDAPRREVGLTRFGRQFS